MGGIYTIENTITLDCYIGSSINLRQRENRHFKDLREGKHHSIILQRAVNKYGIENFEFKVLEFCSNEELLSKEQKYMDSMSPLYNICSTAGSPLGVKHSPETCLKKKKYAIENGMRPPESTWVDKQKVVLMLDYLSGKPIQKFKSLSEACRYLGKDCTFATTISACCKNKRYSAFGYRWVFNESDAEFLRCKKELIAWNKGLKVPNNNNKIVHQFDLGGNLLRSFNSVKDAEKLFGKGISNCATGKSKTSGGFIWKYLLEEK